VVKKSSAGSCLFSYLRRKNRNMLDYSNCHLEQLAVHQIGNQSNDEPLRLSETLVDIDDAELRELLLRYFLQPFTKISAFYNLSGAGEDFTTNSVFQAAAQVFDDPTTFHQHSVKLAKHLYEQSDHPQVKPGDLMVAYFSEMVLDDEVTDAIGFFKSENRQSFLKLQPADTDFSLKYEEGIHIEKMDKACLIFNTDREVGFRVCVIDKPAKPGEEQYWKDIFLHVQPATDVFYYTQHFMNLTKNFVTQELPDELQFTKADKIDLLNKSAAYFKSNESFDKESFEEAVFEKEELREAFRNYNQTYQEENNIDFGEGFDISPQAVKKQARVLKSVLKLDKNFQIYIQGNRDLIEQGVEADGRKFYKIYFEKEE